MEKTLVIIKPDGVKKRLIGECLKRMEKADLAITSIKITQLKRQFMVKFYGHLKKKLNPELFNAIVSYLCSGKVAVAVVEGRNAVAKVRNICGPTNPKAAPRGTIRGDFATDSLEARARQNQATRNIIHASGSRDEALAEIKSIRPLLN